MQTAALAEGIILGTSGDPNVLRLMPPLVVTPEQIAEARAILQTVLEGLDVMTDALDRSYLGAFRGERFVIKLGGEVVLNSAGLDALAADIAVLVREGISLTLVHGGGPQADALAARLGHTPQKVNGRRITTDTDLEIAKMAYGGSINLELLGALRRHGVRGVGLSGVDANLLTVTRRPPRLVRDATDGSEALVDFGHVGDIVDVDATVLHLLCAARMVPVVASLAADNDGAIYNVNADSVAASLAGAFDAAKLFLLTNVGGVLADPADPASRWSVLEHRRLRRPDCAGGHSRRHVAQSPILPGCPGRRGAPHPHPQRHARPFAPAGKLHLRGRRHDDPQSRRQSGLPGRAQRAGGAA